MGEARGRSHAAGNNVAARVRFEVEDTGPGLPPGLEPLVFEPYVRGHKTGAGIGLGLATVRRITEAHGGEVGVFANKERGCTFWFELPCATSQSPAVLSTTSLMRAGGVVGTDKLEPIEKHDRVGL